MVIGLIYAFLVSSFQDIHNKSQIHPEEKKGRRAQQKFYMQGYAWRNTTACIQGAREMSGCSLFKNWWLRWNCYESTEKEAGADATTPTCEAESAGIPARLRGTCCCQRRLPPRTQDPPAPCLQKYPPPPFTSALCICAKKAKWKFEQQTGTHKSTKRYLSPSICQPLHEKDGDLVAQSSPGEGSRSLAAAAPASQSPQPFHGTTAPTHYSALLPRVQRGTRCPPASAATTSSVCRQLRRQGDPQPCGGLLLDVGPRQVSPGDTQPTARSHRTAGRLPSVLGEHCSRQKCTACFPLTVSPQLEAPHLKHFDGGLKEEPGDLGSH